MRTGALVSVSKATDALNELAGTPSLSKGGEKEIPPDAGADTVPTVVNGSGALDWLLRGDGWEPSLLVKVGVGGALAYGTYRLLRRR